jgi:hypothetical protein
MTQPKSLDDILQSVALDGFRQYIIETQVVAPDAYSQDKED